MGVVLGIMRARGGTMPMGCVVCCCVDCKPECVHMPSLDNVEAVTPCAGLAEVLLPCDSQAAHCVPAVFRTRLMILI